MTLILSNAIVNAANADCIYVDEHSYMHVDVTAGTLFIKNIPDDAMQQVAMGFAEGKRFVELDGAELVISTGEEENDIGSDIE